MAKLSKTKIETYYAAIGRFVTEWAEVELFLDLLVVILAKPDLPHQLSGKLSILRKKLRSYQSPHADAILRLLDEIEALAPTRHDYVHGSMIGHAATRSELTVTLARLLQPKGPRQKPVKVTAQKIHETTNRLHKIGGELLELVAAVNDERRTMY